MKLCIGRDERSKLAQTSVKNRTSSSIAFQGNRDKVKRERVRVSGRKVAEKRYMSGPDEAFNGLGMCIADFREHVSIVNWKGKGPGVKRKVRPERASEK
jgi:hypothetical protein